MDVKDIAMILSVLIGFGAQCFGIYLILKGEWKPQRTTRGLYLLMMAITTATTFSQGSTEAFVFSAAITIGQLVIFLLSLKYGVGGRSRIDFVTLVAAIFALVGWWLTSNPTVGLYLAILADMIAFIPTIQKTWIEPTSEDWRFYGVDVISSSFNLLAQKSFLIMDLAFPLYIFVLNLVISVFIILRTKFISGGEE